MPRFLKMQASALDRFGFSQGVFLYLGFLFELCAYA